MDNINDYQHHLQPGTIVSDYQVESVLGEGGFGITYLARDLNIGKRFAIKEYLPLEFALRSGTTQVVVKSESEAGNYQWGMERFLDEARALAAFEHPNINQVHRFFKANGTAYIVLAIVEGEPLSHLLKREGTIPEERLKSLLTDLLKGLEKVHDAGYTHLDIKPGNIMLCPDGTPVLIDFGAARQAMGYKSKSITTVLTPGYAPVEQYATKADDIGPWTDIYSLGIVAYRCLSGCTDSDLTDAVSRSRLLQKNLPDEKMLPAVEVGRGKYSKQFLQAVDSAIEVVETKRPQSVAAMLHQLEFGKGNDTKEKPKAEVVKKLLSQDGGNPKTTFRLPLYFGGALFLLLLAGIGWFYSSVLMHKPLLTITSDPSGAIVYVDNGEVGETPTQIEKITDGTHEVRFTKDQYNDYEKSIYIQQGKPVSLHSVLIPEPYGNLKLTSIPSGATILVDGKEMGLTPATLTRLDQGIRQITLYKTDYAPWQGTVEILPLERVELNPELVTAFGSLQISSTPVGAEVYIDGQKSGVTPFTSDRVQKGKRKVELKFRGFDSWIREVNVGVTGPVVLQADLATVYGSLIVTSVPTGATVSVDDTRVGKTPFQLNQIAKGKHKISLELSDYKNWQSEFDLSAGGREKFSVVLKPASSTHGDIWREPTTGMEFVYLKGGCYQMGSSSSDSYEKPVHKVCVDGFWIGKYEVTNKQYRSFHSSHHSKEHKGKTLDNENQPAVYIRWEDARDYAAWLSEKSGKHIRLPTEAEWEYAARGGTDSVRYWGESVSSTCEYANVHDLTSKRENIDNTWEHHNCDDGYAVTSPVGSFRSNRFGLYDMLGNASEWCSDWYSEDYYSASPSNNPQGASSGAFRVLRGGSWDDAPRNIRSANRFSSDPGTGYDYTGFRLVFAEGE